MRPGLQLHGWRLPRWRRGQVYGGPVGEVKRRLRIGIRRARYSRIPVYDGCETRTSEFAEEAVAHMSYRLRILAVSAFAGLAAISCGIQAASETSSRVAEEGLSATVTTPEAARDVSQDPGLRAAIPAPATAPPIPTASVGSAAASDVFDSQVTLGASVGNRVDDVAEPFTLPGASGKTHSLDSHLGEKNVVLVFYRAFW